MKKKSSMISILSIVATGVSAIASIVHAWASSKEQESLIEEKVNEAITEYFNKESD